MALRENIFSALVQHKSAPPSTKVTAFTEYLKANPDAKVEIIGYPDATTESKTFNLKLSKLRTANIATVLEKARTMPFNHS
ncbi:MAG: hypothetical protein LUH46_11750 [Alistipes sp.]|nr:hypothetical protein [Alistipes sp.]